MPAASGVIGMALNLSPPQLQGLQPERTQYLDPLTRLPNRLWLISHLSQYLDLAKADDKLALLSLNLDAFKTINESFGHSTGDILLQVIAGRLAQLLEGGNAVARMGGDEFMVVMPDCTYQEEAVALAQRLLASVAEAIEIESHEIYITACIGISLFPRDGRDADRLIKHADAAMSEAKRRSRNSYQLYSGNITMAAYNRLLLEGQIRRALIGDEFEVYYQPQIESRSGRIIGSEALLRWQRGDQDWISPTQFIPVAEDMGLLQTLGEWVLQTACTQVRDWHQAGWIDLTVSVNLSMSQFQRTDLVEVIGEILMQSQLPPRCLVLEITESMAAQDVGATVAMLNRLHRMGVKLAIDDFGTGYSSISYLKRFPLDKLKIDQSFIRDLAHVDPASMGDCHDVALVEAIIHLAHCLHLKAVAEGVETQQQLQILQQLDCDEVQGYFVAPPVLADEFFSLLSGEEKGSRPRQSTS
ncbi:MAG: bifunctional diguanylate cyclase/phosphodiesterase [Synechococcaceae cyanobacterium SM2_3_1]|nr:bifunctional diguanylate cyclase/phosphodiesterase [Synechococcaceae cyanobacterium SM2_3_1]